jgi:DNA-binding beta-propeller fold protein YncE
MNWLRACACALALQPFAWAACGGGEDDAGLASLSGGGEDTRSGGGEDTLPAPERHPCRRDGLLYWAEGSVVRSARLDGSAVSTVVTGSVPTAVAVDALARRLYWTDNGTDTVSSADLDGSGARQLYVNADRYSNPRGVSVDVLRRRLYWTESSVVREAALDGTGVGTIATGSVPTGSGIDVLTGQVYWADNGTDTVHRMNNDGSALQQLVSVADRFSNPSAVAVDRLARRMFWTEGSLVRAANLDGTAAVTVATGSYPTGLALDPVERRVYWTDNGTDTVQRMRYNGSALEVLYTNPDRYSNPRGVALYLRVSCSPK